MQSSSDNYRSINKRASTRTFALAKFLATTGPEEYAGHHNYAIPSSSKPNLFDRLRKKTPSTKYIPIQRKHIPLAYDHNQPYYSPPHESSVTRGSRHIQVQTQPIKDEKPDECERCSRRMRRDSCPPVLGAGQLLEKSSHGLAGHETVVLLALIEQLKQQLADEQQSRKVLEKAIQSRWAEKN